MADSANEQCINGKHYIFDSSSNQPVEVGACEDPKHQVVNAAMQAQQAAKGQQQKGAGFDMSNTVLQPTLQNLKQGLGLGN